MSLVRLLTVGRSLSAMEDTPHRYRVPRGSRLPRFGLAEKQGAVSRAASSTSAGTTTIVIRAPEAQAARREMGVKTAAPAAGAGELGFEWQTVVGRIAKVISAVWRGVPSWWVKHADLRSRLARSRRRPWRPVRTAQGVVQCELSLENVRVVRNDLSDADLEVVAGGSVGTKSQTDFAPAASDTSPRERWWQRVTARVRHLWAAKSH